jgi:hypothetical protein
VVPGVTGSTWERTATRPFDGIHVTSGCHLLWGWLLGAVSLPVSRVTLDKGTHQVAMVGAHIALVLVAADVFGRTRTEKAVLALSFLFLTVLMETALLAAP